MSDLREQVRDAIQNAPTGRERWQTLDTMTDAVLAVMREQVEALRKTPSGRKGWTDRDDALREVLALLSGASAA